MFAAEARVILSGMRLCLREGIQRVEVESDALNIIKTMESDS